MKKRISLALSILTGVVLAISACSFTIGGTGFRNSRNSSGELSSSINGFGFSSPSFSSYSSSTSDSSIQQHVHTPNGDIRHNETIHFYVCSGCRAIYDAEPHNYVEVERIEATQEEDGYYVEECTVCGYEHRVTLSCGNKTIRIMATNDIHGQIYKEYQSDTYLSRCGIDKYMTFLKDKKDDGNTLLLDQGDTWQGSVYSNYNQGGLITDLMNYVQYNARTVGNHDFDWGIDAIINNASKSYNDYTTPTLAANVYDYNFETKTEGNHQQSQIGIPSVTYTFDKVKVGVIGTIGANQITTICTNNVKNICFKDHIPIIKSEAQRLRNDEDCDIVILSHHGGQEDLLGNNLDQYLDLALCAHTHKYESTKENNLLYVQGASNNQYVWEINMNINTSTKELGDVIETYYSASQIDNLVDDSHVDSTISELVSSSRETCLNQINIDEVVANNVGGTFSSTNAAANLMADAIYEAATSEGYNIYCSYVNNARHNLGSGEWTYADVFEAFPFDNDVYIMDITAKEMVNEIGEYNYVRKNTNIWPEYFDITDTQTKYRIAIIDYLGVHTNEKRKYDYFPDCEGKVVATLSQKYRPILIDYLKSHHFNDGVRLYAGDYYSNIEQFKRAGCAPTKLCSLTFDYNYDNLGEYYSSYGRQNQAISSCYPSNPSREGYTFTGWYYDTDCTQPVVGLITQDITLYAGWSDGQIQAHDGTIDSPYTVGEALEIGSQYSGSSGYEAAAPRVYITGTVSQAATRLGYTGDLGNVKITDGLGNELLLYWLKKFEGATSSNNFSTQNDLKVGDELLISGQPFRYNGGTIECSTGTYCVSINGVLTNP